MVTDNEKCKDKDKCQSEIFLRILRENMLYLRHQETQRMWTANIFIAIVVGTLVYSIHVGIEQIPWFIPLAFLIVSTLCFLITMKLSQVFSKTQKSIVHIFEDGKIPLCCAPDKNCPTVKEKGGTAEEKGWRRYMAGIKSEKGIWPILRIRYLYLALYILAMIGASAWLFILNKSAFWIAVPIVGVIVIAVMIFAIIKW